ncbi:hypothetical protein BKG92_00560 [Rodentibacter ratti]|uniref:Uncharacterized protein n=1 Tax=Rodentibacter ratti TaxID=1906745 RepID=A0A1V3L399_9PAST|nr:hypothetical protein BKG92_00560 [Rodentibacter ratti]
MRAGASGSIAYGSGGGASVNAAYSKASVDYAQVREQTGIHIGEDTAKTIFLESERMRHSPKERSFF